MKQLIFDCDGVLVDTEIIAAEVMVELLRTYGHELDIEDYINHHTGKTFTAILDSIDIDINDNIELIAKRTEEKIYAELRAIHGMAELLFTLKLPISIVSNSATWQVEKAISFLNLQNVIKRNYFSSEMVERPKPFPDIYLKAASANNVEPEECLVVEDSISGATAALQAGMTVIGFCGASHIKASHSKNLLELGVKKTVNSAAELKLALDQIMN